MGRLEDALTCVQEALLSAKREGRSQGAAGRADAGLWSYGRLYQQVRGNRPEDLDQRRGAPRVLPEGPAAEHSQEALGCPAGAGYIGGVEGGGSKGRGTTQDGEGNGWRQ